MTQEKRKELLTEEEITWLKDHVENSNIWKERRKKIMDAVSIWAVIGTLSAIVAISTGAAKWLLRHLLEILP